jgi:transposase
MYPELRLMQDGASGHRAEATALELKERGVKKIFWPLYSPDLNPIETVWDWMKNYIQEQYPQYEKGRISYDILRKVVKEAWDSISIEQLNELIDSMYQRCQDVIDAEGKYIKW